MFGLDKVTEMRYSVLFCRFVCARWRWIIFFSKNWLNILRFSHLRNEFWHLQVWFFLIPHIRNYFIFLLTKPHSWQFLNTLINPLQTNLFQNFLYAHFPIIYLSKIKVSHFEVYKARGRINIYLIHIFPAKPVLHGKDLLKLKLQFEYLPILQQQINFSLSIIAIPPYIKQKIKLKLLRFIDECTRILSIWNVRILHVL